MSTDRPDADYLLRLIETQPACLMRVRRDGVILACNEAGLGLLGKTQLAEVLEHNLAEQLDPDSRKLWDEFARRVCTTGSGSIECRLAQQDADARPVLFKATALHNHPDQGQSLLLAGRDTLSLDVLQRALETTQKDSGLPPEEGRERITELETNLARALEEKARLAATLEQSQVAADRAASTDESLRQHVARLESDLDAAREGKAHVESLYEAAGRERQRRDAEYLEALGQMKRDLDRAREEIERHKEADKERQELQRQVDELRQALSDAQATIERLAQQQAHAVTELERNARERLTALESELADARAAVQRLAEEHALARLEQERSAEERLSALQSELADARAAIQRLTDEHARATTEHERLAHARLTALQSELTDARAATERLAQEHARAIEEQERKAQEHLSAIRAELAAARSEYERLRAEPRDDERIGVLQDEIAAALMEQEQLRTELARAESDQQRIVAERTADRAAAERTVGEAVFKKNEVLKALADQRVELQQWFAQACALEPLAAAGRLTIDLAEELRSALARVDDRTRFLLALTGLEASYRPEVEGLRTETLRALSLVRQLGPKDESAPADAAPHIKTGDTEIAGASQC